MSRRLERFYMGKFQSQQVTIKNRMKGSWLELYIFGLCLESGAGHSPNPCQKCIKNHLRAKTFPTSPNMWRLVAWNLDFHADSGKTSKWKLFIPRLKPVKDIKGLIIIKSVESCSLKSCGNSLKTLVLRLFKILSADGRASASKIEKMAKNLKILMFFF
jgi:hypothetical protein